MSNIPPPPPPPGDSDPAPGPGWWKASDGNWYPPESHPDAATAAQGVDLASSAQQSEVVDSKPWWQRWWAVAIGVVLAVGVLAAVFSPSDDDSDTATDEIEGAPSTTAASDSSSTTEPESTTTSEPADTRPTATEPEPAATTGTAPPPGAFQEGCDYLGVDTFDDIQVEVRFVNTMDSPGDVTLTFALLDSGGVRFLTESALVPGAVPQERLRIQHDTVEGLPPSVTDDSITCEVLELESFSVGEAPEVPEGSSCSFVSLDFADDIQVELTVSNPFADTTDLAVSYALRGADGVRFDTRTAFVEVVAAGETVRVQDDTVTGFPEWVSQADFSCDVLGVEDFG